MTRRKNVPKKVAKSQRPQTWDKKLKTLQKRYSSVSRKRRENTHLPLHMANVIVGGRLRARFYGDENV